ncbi:MAG TPA: hypothetical protein VM285_14290, partial [Polyangia bacterium]|nr:hypothetical protein [Polyangia bacterium]
IPVRAILFCLLFLAGCGDNAPASPVLLDPWVGEGRTRILVDAIHQLEAPADGVWDASEFRYSHSQSTSRLLAALLGHDHRYRVVRDGELSYELLAAHDVLFFNVPTLITGGSSKSDREMPRLRPGEVDAIMRFMEAGGGVFVVGEHNNAYDNVEVLRPLLAPLGVELLPAYASETGSGRYAMDVGGYITMTRDFDEHFITQNVRMISASGGGPFSVESKGGIAFLSDTGYIDIGNYVTGEPRKSSNHRIEEGEYQGPDIPVSVAVEVGKGRLVAIGDHNMLGTQWLGVGDNARFALNAFQWLAHREDEPRFSDTPLSGLRVGFEQERAGWTIGLRDRDGFYGFFHNLTRRPDVVAMGLLDLADEVDVLGFLDPDVAYPERDLALVEGHLDRGGRVLVLLDAAHLTRGSRQLAARYLPDLIFEGPAGPQRVADLGRGPNQAFPKVLGGNGRLIADGLAMTGRSIAALDHEKSGFKGRKGRDIQPKSYDNAEPYLLEVRALGGEPLAEAELPDGRRVSLITRYAARGGEILLIVQGKVFSAHTLHCIREEPVAANRPAYDLEIALLDWLAGRPPATVVGTQPSQAPPAADAGTDPESAGAPAPE